MDPQSNALHIRDIVNGQTVSFTGTGPADYTYQVGDGSGLCEVCHTATAHYQSDGSGTTHYANDCLSCHTHADGIVIPAVLDLADTPHDGITTCDSCHDGLNDQVADATLDNAKCLACHGPGQSATLAAEHEAPLASDCTDCHNVMRAQSNAKHIKGTIVNAASKRIIYRHRPCRLHICSSVTEAGLCEVCHTATAHYQSDGSRHSALR